MTQRPFQPWDVDQLREASRLRRCGCDAYTIAQMVGVEEGRITSLFFAKSHDENKSLWPCNQATGEAA